MSREIADQLASRAPEIMQKGGAASAGASGVIAFIGNNANFFTACGAIVGALVAIAGLYWQRRTTRERLRMERELHEIKMQELRRDAVKKFQS